MTKILTIMILVFLASCSTQRQVEAVPVKVDLPKITAPKPQPITTLPVKWKVLNRDGLRELLAEMEKNDSSTFVIFALTTRGYENLSLNMAEVKRFMLEQQQVIVFYEKLNDK